MLRWFNRRREVERDPFGLVIGEESIIAVGVEDNDGTLRTRFREREDLHIDPQLVARARAGRASDPDAVALVAARADAVAAALLRLSARLGEDERRCVVAVDDSVMVVETFRLRDGNSLRATLEIEAKRISRFGDDEIRIMLPAGGVEEEDDESDDRVMSVGYGGVERLNAVLAPIEAAGFEVSAVDYEGCAWGRLVPDANVLVVDAGRVLRVFGFVKAVPYMSEFVKDPFGEAGLVAQAVSSLQHKYDLEIKSVVVAADDAFVEKLRQERTMKGFDLSPLMLAGVVNPWWAQAYGLALYALAERLDAEVAYAF